MKKYIPRLKKNLRNIMGAVIVASISGTSSHASNFVEEANLNLSQKELGFFRYHFENCEDFFNNTFKDSPQYFTERLEAIVNNADILFYEEMPYMPRIKTLQAAFQFSAKEIGDRLNNIKVQGENLYRFVFPSEILNFEQYSYQKALFEKYTSTEISTLVKFFEENKIFLSPSVFNDKLEFPGICLEEYKDLCQRVTLLRTQIFNAIIYNKESKIDDIEFKTDSIYENCTDFFSKMREEFDIISKKPELRLHKKLCENMEKFRVQTLSKLEKDCFPTARALKSENDNIFKKYDDFIRQMQQSFNSVREKTVVEELEFTENDLAVLTDIFTTSQMIYNFLLEKDIKYFQSKIDALNEFNDFFSNYVEDKIELKKNIYLSLYNNSGEEIDLKFQYAKKVFNSLKGENSSIYLKLDKIISYFYKAKADDIISLEKGKDNMEIIGILSDYRYSRNLSSSLENLDLKFIYRLQIVTFIHNTFPHNLHREILENAREKRKKLLLNSFSQDGGEILLLILLDKDNRSDKIIENPLYLALKIEMVIERVSFKDSYFLEGGYFREFDKVIEPMKDKDRRIKLKSLLTESDSIFKQELHFEYPQNATGITRNPNGVNTYTYN